MDIEAHGLSCSVGAGWSGSICKHDDGSDDVFAPCLHAGTCSLPSETNGTFGSAVTGDMTSSQVFVSFAEFYPDDVIVPGEGVFEETTMPTPLALGDFSADGVLYGDDPVSPTLVGTQKFCTINGRAFALYVVLGQPTQALVDAANDVVNTIEVDPLDDGYRQAVMATPGLVSYWRLGELSGSTAADEKGVNQGTYVTPLTLGRSGLVAHSSNTAVELPGNMGAGGSVTVPDSSSIRLPNTFTLEAWFKPSTMSPIGNRHVLIHKLNAYRLAITNLGEIELILTKAAGGSVTLMSAPGLIAANQIYHIAAVLGGAPAFGTHGVPCAIYVDGNNVALGTVPTPLGNGGNLIIGGYGNNLSGFAKGTLDEVAIGNEAVPVEEIHTHFRVGADRAPKMDQYAEVVRQTPGLVSYWRLNENNGAVCRDSIGASHGVKSGNWVAASPLIGGSSPDRALTLNTGKISITDTAAQVMPPFTVEAWIGPYNLPSNGYLIRKGTEYFLNVNSSGVLRFGFWPNPPVMPLTANSASGAIAINHIYHVVGSWDGATIRLYVNGALAGSYAWAGARLLNGFPLEFGDGTCIAAIDEVALYNAALSFDDISEHYSIGQGGKLDDPPPPPPPPPAPQPPSPPSDPGPDDPPYFEGTGVELDPDDA